MALRFTAHSGYRNGCWVYGRYNRVCEELSNLAKILHENRYRDRVIGIVNKLLSRISFAYVDEPIRIGGIYAASATNGFVIVLSGVLETAEEIRWSILHELGHVASIRLPSITVLEMCGIMKCVFNDVEDPVEVFANSVATHISRVLNLPVSKPGRGFIGRGVGVSEIGRYARDLTHCVRAPRRGYHR